MIFDIASSGLFVVAIAFQATAPPQPWSSALDAGGRVQIVRDEYGVAHVYADTDEGAFFGLGYAQAEDRLFQMAFVRWAYQGRLAEVLGKGPAQGESFVHVEHDREARILGWERHAADALRRMPAEERRFLEAFADGVNAYVASPGATINPLFASLGAIWTPWEPEDCVGAWYRFGRFFAGQDLGEAAVLAQVEAWTALGWTEAEIAAELAGDQVCDDQGVVVLESDVPAALRARMERFAAAAGVRNDVECLGGVVPHFSQAVALTGSKVSTGEAVLLAEPRIRVHAPNTLYEASAQGATFTVRGACVPGTASFIVGSNGDSAWGVTALGLDQADLFELTVDPVQQPGRYLLDGAWIPFSLDARERLIVRDGPDVELELRETVWGPVVTELLVDCKTDPVSGVGPGCLAGREFASKALPWSALDRDPFRGYVRMYRSRGLERFVAALEDLVWPSMNVVVANASGRIAYVANGACPLRAPNVFLAGEMALDGSTLANDWLGELPHELKPRALDPAADFLVSANNRPIGDWYPFRSLYPGLGDSHRSRRLREVVEAQPVFTPVEIEALHRDRVHPGTRDFAILGQYLRDVQGFALSNDALSALAFLVPWKDAGARMDRTHGGVAVAHFLRDTLRESWAPEPNATYGGGEAGLSNFLRQKIAQISLPTPIDLVASDAAAIDTALSEAFQLLPPEAGTTALMLLRWYTDTQLVGSPSPGKGPPILLGEQQEGNAAWAPVVQIPFGPLLASDLGTNLSQSADSYTQLVRVQIPDASASMLALGVSELPTSEHFRDQQGLWEAGLLKASPSSLAAVQALGATSSKTLFYP